MFNGFSHSVMGASHEKTGLVCQDSSAFKIGNGYAIAVVADGHGSKKHFRSHLGSKFAVEATIETIDRFYEEREDLEANLPVNYKLIIRNIEKQIISNWNIRIEKHLKENPVTAEEKSKFKPEEFEAIPPESYYGSTLVAAVAGDGYTFGLQIGDGSLVAIFEDGKAVMPMEYNESAPQMLQPQFVIPMLLLCSAASMHLIKDSSLSSVLPMDYTLHSEVNSIFSIIIPL